MHAEIIAVGDEITSGQLLDTNSRWLSRRLEELGIRVLYHTTVGDELDPCAEVFRRAVDRADVVLATGGLGPTADDLTRQALAKALGRELQLDPDALEHVRGMFARRNRRMPKSNEQQAMFPTGARMVSNPHGTAPGIDIEVPRQRRGPARVVALPGVPAEMEQMWHDSVADRLRRVGGGRSLVRHRRINCFGAGESQIEAMLPELICRGRTPRVGINASQATIILRITAEGATEGECHAAMQPTVATIRRCLAELVFGEEDEQLQHAVVKLLRGQDKTLSTAEWGTGGLLSGWLDGVAEAEGHYVAGLVAAGQPALQDVLGVDPGLLPPRWSGGGEAVRAMALGCRRRFATDYALAVGLFGRLGSSASGPEPVFFGLATLDGVNVEQHPYAGHPDVLKVFSAKRALDLLRLTLLKRQRAARLDE